MDEEEYLPFGTTNPVGDENRAILIKKEKNYNLTRICVIFLCLILFFLGFFTYKLYEKSMRVVPKQWMLSDDAAMIKMMITIAANGARIKKMGKGL